MKTEILMREMRRVQPDAQIGSHPWMPVVFSIMANGLKVGTAELNITDGESVTVKKLNLFKEASRFEDFKAIADRANLPYSILSGSGEEDDAL